MSNHTRIEHQTVPSLRERKGGLPIVCLTAYSAPMARLLDPLVDVLLVGDSVGMVLYGMETTLGVTLDMMIAHGTAVKRASHRACVVVDMPFGSYQESPRLAYRAAARVMAETGCDAIKLEGGTKMAETVSFIVDRGIPVMGHVGLMPQSVKAAGGYGIQGRDPTAASRIYEDAIAVDKAGAFSLVTEGITDSLARKITADVRGPTIGIGASPACDGQVLVTEDMVGLFDQFKPRFVKTYAQLAEQVKSAVAAYAEDVRTRRFPGPEHCVDTLK